MPWDERTTTAHIATNLLVERPLGRHGRAGNVIRSPGFPYLRQDDLIATEPTMFTNLVGRTRTIAIYVAAFMAYMAAFRMGVMTTGSDESIKLV